ncbi:hypothetical protein XA68_16257 [Ophiocordyceps unilateralis]|uniref:MYND-type domain-containing protein n=1 Tax=Ophiocordyceps unilateralis TaxID=268505 RepID=A0A2A9P5J3_OPHUN|nr:hypothetical protein XA68_16257 [Ophiocordyceps unilateralis]
MAEIPLLPAACAHWTRQGFWCKNPGTKTCSNCKLVVYCGVSCQRAHWPEHRKQCKSAMAKQSWRPAWDCEFRRPAWAGDAAADTRHNPLGGRKHLWGNTPAIDMLQLEKNEGLDYQKDLSLLLAGESSGDLRHVVKTLSDVPETIHQQLHVVVNDGDFDVVARNVILLLLAFDGFRDEASSVASIIEAIIHVWYSAFIPQTVFSRLQQRVKPLIDDVCSRLASENPDLVIRKSWEASNGASLNLVLRQEDWFRLRQFVNLPDGLTKEEASRIRAAVTLAPERADYRDRWNYKEATPFMRIAKQRFREDGLLLPFGHPRLGFDIPNPTLFQSKTWTLHDQADPTGGWTISAVGQRSWPAPGDWYGKLVAHLTMLLDKFITKLGKNFVCFQLFHTDARMLPLFLGARKYCRIEVSDMFDGGGFVGIHQTLSTLSPYLQHPKVNPHATLITVFINAVKEMSLLENPAGEVPNVNILSRLLPRPSMLSLAFNDSADLTRLWDARFLVTNVERLFQSYMAVCRFDTISAEVRVEMKADNTIVEKWPTRFNFRPGQNGNVDEFRLRLGSIFTHLERYVEWKRR